MPSMTGLKAESKAKVEKPFISVLNGKRAGHVPFWLMRQAGRYLPEYRELRAKAGSFLDLVYNPDLAAEVTLQPLRRFGMDAAILFSDILVIPQALGQRVEFTAGEGPKLESLQMGRLSFNEKFLAPVYETVAKVRAKLAAEGFAQAALIGFAGAPWTVATYMVEGGGSRDFEKTKSWAYRDPEGFSQLIGLIAEATEKYLLRQIEAGAEAVQLFDSWAGALDEAQYRQWVIAPTRKIAGALKKKYPRVPLIGFPKGSGALYESYARETGITALGLDAQVPLVFARLLQKQCPVQGNLDPVCLLTGGAAMENAARNILGSLSDGPFVFNLGHGVIKETPAAHVQRLAEIIRGWRV